MRRPFRIFHFDIATQNNFGDTLLFPATKTVFEAFGAGRAFEVYDSRPLREKVGPAVVDYINATADAVLVGGGGLFLADTNPNRESGWQWRISLEMLERLRVPIIVFAVGYNRFYGQSDFAAPFSEHLAATLDKSVFFGLRNHGSIERISAYVNDARADKLRFQPCATTLMKSLLPGDFAQPDRKRIGVQLSHGPREQAAGITADHVVEAADLTLARLEDDGWQVIELPFAKQDPPVMDALSTGKRARARIPMFDSGALERGLRTLTAVPFILGTRGHAQMVPFGMGAVPFSLDVHPKLTYFLNDIGHPEWVQDCADPRQCADALVGWAREGWENRERIRADLARRQDGFLTTTQHNLHDIYTGLGGDPSDLPGDPSAPTGVAWQPYDEQAAHLASSRFLLEVQRENSILRARTSARRLADVKAELATTRERLTTVQRDNQTAAADVKALKLELRRARLTSRPPAEQQKGHNQ